jgi:hypothetical protein
MVGSKAQKKKDPVHPVESCLTAYSLSVSCFDLCVSKRSGLLAGRATKEGAQIYNTQQVMTAETCRKKAEAT